MIKQITKTKPVALKRQQEMLDREPYVLRRFQETLVARERKTMTAQINKPVRKSPRPFVWSNDKAANLRAARWYFKAVADGRIPTEGGRYKRSGKMKKAFFVEGNYTDLSASVTIGFQGDGAKGAEYVYGLKQIPGHRAYPRLATMARQSAERQSKGMNEMFRAYRKTGNVGQAIAASRSGV